MSNKVGSIKLHDLGADERAKILDRVVARSHEDLRGCWVYDGARSPEGYGRFRTLYVHRLSYTHHNAPIPEGMVVDHLCRNRACWRPDHLDMVTQRVNVLRGESPGAKIRLSGTCARGHSGDTWVSADGKRRQCRICSRERQRAWRHGKQGAIRGGGS